MLSFLNYMLTILVTVIVTTATVLYFGYIEYTQYISENYVVIPKPF